MSKSLQDQLLGAGIANKKQANKAKKAKKQQFKEKKSGTAAVDDTADKIRAEELAKAERDRELNRQRDEAARQKERAAQIRQIVSHSRIDRPQESDISFNVTHGKYIRAIPVSAEQQRHLTAGYLAVVAIDDSFELVPAKAAEKIVSRDEDCVVHWNRDVGAGQDTSQADEDDPYAGYEIPNDLVW